ncbi:MAG: hypothetical protein ABIQ16_25840 [Polyangiaceae bacterium]
MQRSANEVMADAALFGVRPAHDQHACVLAWLELKRVREVQIVSYEEVALG